MMAIILAAEIAVCAAMFCFGHRAGYQKAVADWNMRKRGRHGQDQNDNRLRSCGRQRPKKDTEVVWDGITDI